MLTFEWGKKGPALATMRIQREESRYCAGVSKIPSRVLGTTDVTTVSDNFSACGMMLRSDSSSSLSSVACTTTKSVDEEVHGTKRMKQSPSKLSTAGPSGYWNVANDMGTDDTTPSSPKFPSSSSSLGPLDDSSQEDGMDTEAVANKYSHCMKPGCSCRVDADDANLTGASFDYYSDLLAGAIRRTSVAAIRPVPSTGTFCIDVFMIQTKHKKASKIPFRMPNYPTQAAAEDDALAFRIWVWLGQSYPWYSIKYRQIQLDVENARGKIQRGRLSPEKENVLILARATSVGVDVDALETAPDGDE